MDLRDRVDGRAGVRCGRGLRCFDGFVDAAVTWLDGQRAAPGCLLERSFYVARAASVVPGVAWLPPEGVPAAPLVLLGHGGSGHKRSDRVARLGRSLADAGVAAVAIDGPYHGDRIQSPLPAGGYQGLIEAEGMDAVLDRMVEDWSATIVAVSDLPEVDSTRLGYVGMSMGTRIGLPLAAALGGALGCAVFGKFGVDANGLYPGMDLDARILRDAETVTAATLFHVQWDDELFPREGQLALFGALGSTDKRLIAWPGPHQQTDPRAETSWIAFVREYLQCQRSPESP